MNQKDETCISKTNFKKKTLVYKLESQDNLFNFYKNLNFAIFETSNLLKLIFQKDTILKKL